MIAEAAGTLFQRERAYAESPQKCPVIPPQEHAGEEPAGRARYSVLREILCVMACWKTLRMLEGSHSFDFQSETSDMCGGFGTLRSKGSLHGGLAVSRRMSADKPAVQSR